MITNKGAIYTDGEMQMSKAETEGKRMAENHLTLSRLLKHMTEEAMSVFLADRKIEAFDTYRFYLRPEYDFDKATIDGVLKVELALEWVQR